MRADCPRGAQADALRAAHVDSDAFVAVDDAGVVIEWSPRAEQLFGWCAEQAIGRDLASLVLKEEASARPRLELADLLQNSSAGTWAGLQVEACHRDLKRLTVAVAVWPSTRTDGGFNVLFHDLSDRRQREEAVERLAAVVDCWDDPIVSTTLDGTVLSWNQGAEHLYGFSENETLGRSVFLIVPPDRRPELDIALRNLARGERVPHRETVRQAKSGSMVDVAVAMFPIRDAQGSVVAASIVDRDLTESRWMATTLDVTLKTITDALADAQAAEATTRRFLADAAHQLRTPLAGIRAAAENILLGAEAADRDGLVADVIREATRAGRLLGSLLQIARLDEGEAVAPAPCDLVALCADEADRIWSLAPQLDIVLRAEQLGYPRPVLDEAAVREIVANLLDNARRHASAGIKVTVADAAGGVEVRVSDDGPGLPEGTEEKVFDRFVSLDGRGGSGLGLSIARGLARAHGGDLFYDGSGFVLRLPASGPPEAL